MKVLNYIFTAAVIVLLPFSQHVQASSSGITGFSQGAGCNACHRYGITPTLVLSGPTTVEPGLTYTYTLTMSGGQQNSGGLNVTATDGSLIAGWRSAVTNGELYHVAPFYADAAGQIVWTFDWTAPLVDASVVVYAAALSANNNFSINGDAGATTTLAITVGTGGGGPVETGESLYIANCQGCHGAPPGEKAGRTAAQIQVAIDANTGNMGSLSFLNATQVQLIADFLSGQPQAPVAVHGGPYAGEVNIPVSFDGFGSTDADGVIVSYSWDFGDGSTGTGATPSHTYTVAGNYTVTLTVTDDRTMTGSASTSANIGVPAVYDGVALYGTHCSSCHGTLASSTKAGRTAAQIQGAIDGNVGSMGSLSTLIPEEVQAIADALAGIGQPPVAVAGGPYSGEVNIAVAFDGSGSSDADGTIVSYAWNFGDGSTGTGVTPSHTYTAAGNYTVTLTVTDDSSMTGSASTSANIGVPAVYDGVALYGTHCSACHGTLASSSKAGSTAAQIQGAIDGNVGGMGSLSGLIPEEVQAISDALSGLSPIPVANPGGSYTGIAGTAVQFDGSGSTDADGTITIYAWNFGDGTTGTAVSPSHTYTAAGTYTVSLTVTDNDGNSNTATTTATIGTDTNPPVLDGLALYDANCAGCHGAAPGTKAGRTAAQIRSAINLVQSMNGLSGLTDAELQAIAAAIDTGTAPPTDGKGLYDQFCASCHGPEGKGGSDGDVDGKSAESIQKAINGKSEMQFLDSLLSAEDVALIADYLNGGGGGGTIVVTKKSQYDAYCLACHGPEGRGGAEENVRGDSADKIKHAIEKEKEMNFLSGLSDQIVKAIADYLKGDDNGTIEIPAPPSGGGGTDGLALYGTFCAGCHGNAPGTKAGRTAAQIQAAIDGVGSMGGLTGLTAAEVQAIADAIGGGGGGGGTGGLALYDANCAGCHAAAPGTKANRTAAQIQAAIDGLSSMSGLSGLTAADVQAIADAIYTGAPPPTDGKGLYDSFCAACHGPGGKGGSDGNVDGKSAESIQKAIDKESEMNYLDSLLNSEQVSLIAEYLKN